MDRGSSNSQVHVEVESEVNEIFMKSKITQQFINNENNQLELKIKIYKKIRYYFFFFYC